MISKSEWMKATTRSALKVAGYVSALPVGVCALAGFLVGGELVRRSLTAESPRLAYGPVARGEWEPQLGGLVGVVLLVLLVMVLRNQMPALVRVLQQRPGDVVWIYRTIVTGRGVSGVYDSWVSIGTVDGHSIE